MADDARIGEHDVQPTVPIDGIIHDSLDGRFVTGIELTNMHIDARVERLDLPLMGLQMRCVRVTEVDGPGAIAGELMGACPSDANG